MQNEYDMKKEDFLFEVEGYFTVKVDYEQTKLLECDFYKPGYYLLLPNCIEFTITDKYIECKQYIIPPSTIAFKTLSKPTLSLIKEGNERKILIESKEHYKIEIYNLKNINKEFLQLLIDRDI